MFLRFISTNVTWTTNLLKNAAQKNNQHQPSLSPSPSLPRSPVPRASSNLSPNTAQKKNVPVFLPHRADSSTTSPGQRKITNLLTNAAQGNNQHRPPLYSSSPSLPRSPVPGTSSNLSPKAGSSLQVHSKQQHILPSVQPRSAGFSALTISSNLRLHPTQNKVLPVGLSCLLIHVYHYSRALLLK